MDAENKDEKRNLKVPFSDFKSRLSGFKSQEWNFKSGKLTFKSQVSDFKSEKWNFKVSIAIKI